MGVSQAEGERGGERSKADGRRVSTRQKEEESVGGERDVHNA